MSCIDGACAAVETEPIFHDDLDIKKSKLVGKEYDPVTFDILKVKGEDFASQITLVALPYFKKISAEELSLCGWLRKDKETLAPNIIQFTYRFNVICLWTQSSILDGLEVNRRAQIIGHFIKIAKCLLQINNIYSAFAVVSALLSQPIYRLSRTWLLVSRSLYLTDIAYCTAVRKKDPQQAYQQEQNINGILRVIASFQDSNYDHLPRIDCVQKYIESAEFQKEFLSVTEGQLYEKSLEREPESSSKNPLSPTRHFSLPRWSILSGRSSRGGTPSISKLPIREKGSPSLKIKESSPKIKTKSLTPNLTLASKTGRFVKGHKKAQSLGNEAMVMGVDNPTFLSIAPDLSPSMLNSNDSIDKILKNTQSNFRFNTQPSSNLLSAEKPIDLSDISDLMLDSTASSSVFETSVRSDFDVPDDGVFELGKNIETINLNGSSTPRKSTNSSEGRTPRSMRKMLSLRSMRRSENYGKRPRSAEKLKISIDNSDEPLLYELDRSEPEIQGSVHRCVIRGPKSKEIFLKYSQRYFLELRQGNLYEFEKKSLVFHCSCERDLYKLKPRRMMGFKDGWEVIRGDEEEPNFELHQPSTGRQIF
uniref:Coiled-coil domain-containing protein 25 n=1 Tax=Acrobeloides nanus TaxID=290746 RepID=A0A914D5X7_9BILA